MHYIVKMEKENGFLVVVDGTDDPGAGPKLVQVSIGEGHESRVFRFQVGWETGKSDLVRAGTVSPVSALPFCYSGFPSPSDSGLYCTNSLLECPVHLDAVHQSMGSSPFRFDGRCNRHPAGA